MSNWSRMRWVSKLLLLLVALTGSLAVADGESLDPAVYEDCLNLARKAMRGLKCDETIDQLAGDVIAKQWEKKPELFGWDEKSRKKWIRTAAKNKLVDWVRKEKTWLRNVTDACKSTVPRYGMTGLDKITSDELESELASFLSTLSDENRLVWYMTNDGLSSDKVASELEISSSSVRRRYHMLKYGLMGWLDERGYEVAQDRRQSRSYRRVLHKLSAKRKAVAGESAYADAVAWLPPDTRKALTGQSANVDFLAGLSPAIRQSWTFQRKRVDPLGGPFPAKRQTMTGQSAYLTTFGGLSPTMRHAFIGQSSVWAHARAGNLSEYSVLSGQFGRVGVAAEYSIIGGRLVRVGRVGRGTGVLSKLSSAMRYLKYLRF